MLVNLRTYFKKEINLFKKMIKKIVFILAVIPIILGVSVTKLNVQNYDNMVNKSKDIWLIEFYSERCGTCQEFEPIWKTVIPKIKNIKIGRVNIDDEQGLKLAEQMEMLEEGIPRVILSYGNKQIITIMKGTDDLFDENKLLSTINLNIRKITKSQNSDL